MLSLFLFRLIFYYSNLTHKPNQTKHDQSKHLILFSIYDKFSKN